MYIVIGSVFFFSLFLVRRVYVECETEKDKLANECAIENKRTKKKNTTKCAINQIELSFAYTKRHTKPQPI